MDVPDALSTAQVDPRLVADIDHIEIEGLLGDLRRVESLVAFVVIVGAFCAVCLLQFG